MDSFLTVNGVSDVLHQVGLSVNHVVASSFELGGRTGMYFDTIRDDKDRRMVLVITTYALDENGGRYIGSDGEVATETRRFFLESLGALEACPTV